MVLMLVLIPTIVIPAGIFIMPKFSGQGLGPAATLMFCTLIPAPIIFLVIHLFELSRWEENGRRLKTLKAEEEEAARLAKIAETRKAEREAKLARQESELYSIASICSRTEVNYSKLAESLEQAEGWANRARGHFQSGAFPPYWQAIENAHVWLGTYHDVSRQIIEDKKSYTDSYSLCLEFKSADRLPEFPNPETARTIVESAVRIADSIDQLSYEGLRNHYAALIWEQRRTTTAVISGFGKLEHVLSDMSRRVLEASTSLSTALSTNAAHLNEGFERLRAHGISLENQGRRADADRRELLKNVKRIADDGK